MHLKSNNLFNRVLASSVAVFLTATSLYAIPPHPCDEPPPPVCCDEPKPGPFAFSYPFDMDLNCPRDFYFNVEGLAFQAKQDGMDFAIQDTSSDLNLINHGKLEGFSGSNNDWDWSPGLRVGLGFYLDHDAWNIDFNWTYVNVTNYQHANASTPGGRILPLWILGNSTPAAQVNGTRSSATWNADYNTIDIRLGKPYYVSRYLIFNPHFGVRGAWIDQHFSVSYGGTGEGNRTIHHGDNDFWGVGARCGFDTDWVLGKGWKLFGNVATSLLFGKFEIDQSMQIPDGGTAFDLRYNSYQNQPNLEIALGIAWGMHFNKKRNHVGLALAYEFHEWWDQLNMRRFYSGGTNGGAWANDVVSRGNFTLNGLSLSLRFDI